MSIMSPDSANIHYFVKNDTGVLEIQLHDDSDTDGTGAGLYCQLGSTWQESLDELKRLYNFVLESQKL